MLFGRIDHVGVAVEDLDAAIELYGSRFDMREQHRETVEEQGVEAVLLEIGDGHVELLRPLSEDTAVGKFLSKRGPGLHHVAYQTDDIDRTLGAVREAGIGQVCMGEVRGRAPDEFDFGNSPFEVSAVDFSGKTIIQRTSAGTQSIVSASQAKRRDRAWPSRAPTTGRRGRNGPALGRARGRGSCRPSGHCW